MPSEIWQSAGTWNWRSTRECTTFARWRTWTECNSRFIWRSTRTTTDLSQCRNIIGNWFTILFQIRRRPCWVSTTRTTKWCLQTLSVPMCAIRCHGSLGPSQTLTRATRFVAQQPNCLKQLTTLQTWTCPCLFNIPASTVKYFFFFFFFCGI